MSEDKVEAMFPTAAATSRMLKSGMTLTQIYNEYVQVTDSLRIEKDENKRLNSYLDQILQVNNICRQSDHAKISLSEHNLYCECSFSGKNTI